MKPAILIFTLALCTRLAAADFSTRFEELKRAATPAQLYTLLYDLPKGGDLHNHLGGAVRPEWWYELATNPKLNGGDTIYTRVKFSTTPGTDEELTSAPTPGASSRPPCRPTTCASTSSRPN
jgi:hypothetical protein